MAFDSSVTTFLFLFFVVATTTTKTIAAAAKNITIGTTLTAGQATSSWSSPSGDFAFGFYPLNSSLFVLAIWFNTTSPAAIVWTPNYTVPELQSSSTLQLTENGELSLKDHIGTEVWNAEVVQASAAAILDSGNLVLIGDGPTNFLWQSFDHFMDTLLPGQSMPLGTVLRSRLTASDFSEGRFQLGVQTDGNLVLYQMSLLGGARYKPYWASGTADSGGQSLVYNTSGNLYFTLSNETRVNFFSSLTYSPDDYFQRATLDVDGVFRKYVYPRSNSNNNGEQVWRIIDHIPDDICTAITDDNGSGACGYNSYCTLDAQGLVQCNCPQGYSFIDPVKQYEGCAPDFAPQSCLNNGTSPTDHYNFVSVNGLDWPLSDYEHYSNVNEQQCSDNCLNDCFCAVLIYGNNECWKKKLPLSNGRMGAQRVALIKVGKTDASLPSSDHQLIAENEQRSTWIIAVISSGTVNVITIALIIVLLLCYKKKKNNLKRHQPEDKMTELNLKSFTYKELENATNGFSVEIGKGSFGTVYKGLLQSSVPKKIAVKKLITMLQENEKEFINEARAIGQTHHKNLVKLIGVCNEGSHRILVNEYMTNGSLDKFLFGSVRPNWNQRIQIALNIARGLLYLHEECSTQIIHCDIKPQNVLLDDSFIAKISDFGLAKLLKTDQSKTNISIRGTRGYVAPEWFKGKNITKKVDIYSFGILLLEIISCRKSLGEATNEEEPMILADWSYDCYKEGILDVVVDDEGEAMSDFRRLERFVMVGLWCIQENPSLRPSMYKVIQMLEGSVEVPLPPDPLP